MEHVVVKNPGYRTCRPTSIKIVIKKLDKDKFKDMENFVKKIGMCIFPDYQKEYRPIICKEEGEGVFFYSK